MKRFTKISLFCASISALTLASLVSCGGAENGAEDITISGTIGGLTLMSVDRAEKKVSTLAAASYEVSCVSFSSSPVARAGAVDGSGHFSLSLPSSTPFGCFLRDATTNNAVASFAIQGAGGLSSPDVPSLNFNGNVDLGSLTVTNGQIAIPRSRVEAQLTPPASTGTNFLKNITDKEWNLECISTGDTTSDTNCQHFVTESGGKVYLRILHGASPDIYAIGVWGSKTNFQNCGSIDVTTSGKTSLESGVGVGFSIDTTGDFKVETAASFSNWNGTCALRGIHGNAGDADAHKGIEALYFFEPLSLIGGNSFSSGTVDGHRTCGSVDIDETTNFTFTVSDSNTMYGAFSGLKCDSGTPVQQNFNIKITKI